MEKGELVKILKKLNYSWANMCHHLSYGMVGLPEGKMKSREGREAEPLNAFATMLIQSVFRSKA